MNYFHDKAHRVIAGIMLFLVVAIALGVAVGVHSNEKGQQRNQQQQQQVQNQQSQEQQEVSTWYNGLGYTDMQAVQTDLGQLQTDADGGNTLAAEADGSTLATDAGNAVLNPPPVETSQYVAAMGELEAAGNDAAAGDFTDSTTELQTASAQINAITAYLNANGA